MCGIMGFTSQTLSEEEIREYFDRTIPRGPDMSRIEKTQTGYLCFHRLAIMGLTKEGMQPFHMAGDMCVMQRRTVPLPPAEGGAGTGL